MEVFINQDIRKHKPRDIGRFSLPEAGAIAVAMVLGYTVYALERHYFGVQTPNMIEMLPIVLVVIPPIAFGFGKIHGLSFNKYLKTSFVENYVNPQTRIFQSSMEFDYDISEFSAEELDAIRESLSQVDPDCAIDEKTGKLIKRKLSKEEKAEMAEWKGYK